MKSISRCLLGTMMIALCACGGGKDAATTPADPELAATPVEADAESAAPAEGEASTDAEAEAAAPAAAADAPVCDRLCDAVLTCAKEMSGKEPTDEEQQQFLGQCAAKCAEEDPDKLAQAGVCADENKGNCAGLFPCLDKIDDSE